MAVKIYYAKPDPNAWTDVALVGALTLLTEPTSQQLVLKLVDMEAEMVLWQFALKTSVDYVQDLPYFHSFPGDVCDAR